MHVVFDGDEGAPALLILAHGAGAPMDSPFMNDVAKGVAARGIRIARFEFPYMAERRSGRRRAPDRQPVLEATWRTVVDELRDDRTLLIGGKSLGGRIASIVADELGVAGLVCLGYPFHPPGKPEVLRTRHLATLHTPTLILQGTRDALGSREEVARYVLADSIEVVWLEDGDHSLTPRKRSGRTLEQNLGEAVEAIVEFAEIVRK
jgi:uncharacterized protein